MNFPKKAKQKDTNQVVVMRVFLILFFLCFSNFGGLATKATHLYSTDLQIFLVFLWCIFFIFYLLLKKGNRHDFFTLLHSKKLGLITCFITILVAIEIANSFFLGNRSLLSDITKNSFYFLAIFSLYPISFLISFFLKMDARFFRRVFLLSNSFFCMLGILQMVSIFFNGPLFIISSYSFRNGLPRFSPTYSFGWIAICYAYSAFLNNQKQDRFIYMSSALLTIFCDLFIVQTRGQIVCTCFLLLLITIFQIWLRNKFRWSIFCYVCLCLFFAGIISFGTFCITNHPLASSLFFDDMSAMTRVDGIRFYFSEFLNRPIFGYGFAANATRSGSAFFLYYGYEGVWYKDDIGIFGLIDEFGIFGFLLFTFVIVFLGTSMDKIKRQSPTGKILCFSIAIFFVITMTTLSAFDKQRFLLLCACLSLSFSLSNDQITGIQETAMAI